MVEYIVFHNLFNFLPSNVDRYGRYCAINLKRQLVHVTFINNLTNRYRKLDEPGQLHELAGGETGREILGIGQIQSKCRDFDVSVHRF